MKKHQQGFAYIAAIMIVVVLAMLGVAAVRMATTQETGATQDELSARAWQAARAGNDWGLYQALKLGSCPVASTSLDFRANNGFIVTVSCTATTRYEGETVAGAPNAKTIYEIDAIACNSNTTVSCPGSAQQMPNPGYVERRRTVSACIRPTTPARDCYGDDANL